MPSAALRISRKSGAKSKLAMCESGAPPAGSWFQCASNVAGRSSPRTGPLTTNEWGITNEDSFSGFVYPPFACQKKFDRFRGRGETSLDAGSNKRDTLPLRNFHLENSCLFPPRVLLINSCSTGWGLHVSSGGRLVCAAHFLQLPAAIAAAV